MRITTMSSVLSPLLDASSTNSIDLAQTEQSDQGLHCLSLSYTCHSNVAQANMCNRRFKQTAFSYAFFRCFKGKIFSHFMT